MARRLKKNSDDRAKQWAALKSRFESARAKLLMAGTEGRGEIAEALEDQDITAGGLQKILDKESPSAAESRMVAAVAKDLTERIRDMAMARTHLRVKDRARVKAEEAAKPKPSKPRKPGKERKPPKHKPGRRRVAEGEVIIPGLKDSKGNKKRGLKWFINRVPSAWNSAGKVTEYSLEPRIEMASRSGATELKHRQKGAGKIVPPEGMDEGEEICLVWGDPKKGQDPEQCIKYGFIPRVFTSKLMMAYPPRRAGSGDVMRRPIDGIDNLQALHPLLSKQMVSRGAKPDDFVPRDRATIAQDGARPGFLPDDEFTDYRRRRGLAGITWEEQRAHDLGIKIRRVINKAKLWYDEHGLKAGARKSRAGARKRKHEEHSGRSFRPVSEVAALPSGAERTGGRTPRDLRVLREQRRQKEEKERKRRKKMGLKGKGTSRRLIEEFEAEAKAARKKLKAEEDRKRKQRKMIEEVREQRGLPPLFPESNPRLSLTKKQREELLAKDFGLSKKRLYPTHTIRWARQSNNDAIQDFDKGKITKSECKRVVKKANTQIEKIIDDAVGRYVNPGGPSENPAPAFLKRIRKDPSAAPKEQARASANQYMQGRKRFDMSARQGRPRWDYLMEAYDAIENARANFQVAGMVQDARSAQGQKKATQEMLLAFLEQGETGEVIVSGPTSIHTGWWYDLGLKEEPKSFAAVERAYRRRAKEVHPDRGGSEKKFRRLVAARTCAAAYLGGPMQAPDLAENPSKSEHKKLGLQFLKKSQTYWEKYYKGRANTDLLAAYKWLVLAEQELKFAGDKAGLKEARSGLRAATDEMKDRLD